VQTTFTQRMAHAVVRCSTISWVVAVVLAILAASHTAARTSQKERVNNPSCAVIGRLPLDSPAISTMFLRTDRSTGHQLLYLLGSSQRALLTVDVSAPARPIALEPVPYPENVVAGITRTIGTNTLLVDHAANELMGRPNARKVSLLELSASGHPTVCLQFENVTAYLLDESRDLVYFANDHGLSIVHYKGPADEAVKIWEQSLQSR
jgi:hypothetical protein